MFKTITEKPFQIGVFINKISEYTMAKPGIIDIHVKASGRDGRKTKLGTHSHILSNMKQMDPHVLERF